MDLPRRIGYFELWSQNRPCDQFNPEQIAAGALTHINIAFAGIDSGFSITDTDGGMVARVAHLKKRYIGLKVAIAVGMWQTFAIGYMSKSLTLP
jgi:chitinase